MSDKGNKIEKDMHDVQDREKEFMTYPSQKREQDSKFYLVDQDSIPYNNEASLY